MVIIPLIGPKDCYIMGGKTMFYDKYHTSIKVLVRNELGHCSNEKMGSKQV